MGVGVVLGARRCEKETAQGISEGMKNYNRVLMLVKAWKASKRS